MKRVEGGSPHYPVQPCCISDCLQKDSAGAYPHRLAQVDPLTSHTLKRAFYSSTLLDESKTLVWNNQLMNQQEHVDKFVDQNLLKKVFRTTLPL